MQFQDYHIPMLNQILFSHLSQNVKQPEHNKKNAKNIKQLQNLIANNNNTDSQWAYGVVVSTFVDHHGDQGSNPGWAVKFDIANLHINSILRE